MADGFDPNKYIQENQTTTTFDPNAYLQQAETLKKKEKASAGEVSTSASQQPLEQPTEQQPKSGGEGEEILSLPESYTSDRKNYSELVGGKKYKLKRGGVDVIGSWDSDNQNFVIEPLLNTAPQLKPKGGIIERVEGAVNPLKEKYETEEDVIARNYSAAEDAENKIAKKATEIQSLANVPLLQQLDQLKRSGASESEIKAVEQTPIESKDIPSIRFQKGSEGQVFQNLNVNLPTEEYKGEVMDVPLKKLLPEDYAEVKTVGELYNKINEDYAAIQDYSQQIGQFKKVVNEKRVANLPQEDKDYLAKLQNTPMYEEELAKTLERNGATENVAMGAAIGLKHKLDNLYSLGDNIGLSNEQMAEKMRTELAKEQLFGVQPKGAAEVASMFGGMAPDLALAAVSGGYGMMASMLSTMQRDKLKEYYAEQFSKGIKTPDQTKAWEYATASTIKEVPMLMAAGKLSSIGGNVIGRTTMEKSFNLAKDVIKKASVDAAVFGGLSGYSQNKINKLFDVAEHDEYLKSGLMYGLMGGVFGLAHGLSASGKPKIPEKMRNEVDYIASYLPDNVSQKEVENLVKSGKILPSDGEAITNRMANYRQMRAQIPTEITFGQAEKIYPLWEEKTSLQSQMDGASGEFKKVLQGKLQDVDRNIMVKAAVPLSAEEAATRRELMGKEAKGESIDKVELKYLNDRYEAAKELKAAKKAEEDTQKGIKEQEQEQIIPEGGQEIKPTADDTENITGLPSQERIGQEPIETEPIEEGGGGEISGSGMVLETPQEEVAPPETVSQAKALSNVEETAKALEGKDIDLSKIKELTMPVYEWAKIVNNNYKGIKHYEPSSNEVQGIKKAIQKNGLSSLQGKIRGKINENGDLMLVDGNHRIIALNEINPNQKITIPIEGVKGEIKLDIKGYDLKSPVTKINSKQISEAYHKAKADGSNPELVKAVEDLLGKPAETVSETKVETPTETIETVKETQKPEPTEQSAIFAEVNAAKSQVARDKAFSKFQKMENKAREVYDNFDNYITKLRERAKEKGIEFETDC